MASSCSSPFEDLIVPFPLELKETEAVAERVGHPGQEPPGPFFDAALEPGACRPGAGDRRLDVPDGQVEMDRRPMAAIVPSRLRPLEGLRAGLIHQQEDRRRGAEQFNGALTEPPPRPQSKPADVEID